ncbi:MAG: NAD(P)-dependent alcohol dehydrogenase [Deinococcales bacterium]
MSTVVHVEGSQRGARSPASAVPARMTAVVQHVYGTTDTLAVEQVEVPSLEPREVLLRVRAAAVNPADRAILQGLPYVLRLVYGIPRPRTGIRGSDVAGVVEAVGVAVTQFGAGDEVFGWCQGAFAEYAATTETSLAAKPAALSFEQAAAVPMAGITALQALRDQAGLEAGQRVLVNGASGGVGTFAVQVAKAMGAEVTGVCSTRNVELVRTIGADHVIDYTLLIPNSMAGNRWFGSIGRVLTALVTSPFVRQNLRPFFSIPKKTDLLVLVDLLEAGRITPVIDSTHPLGDAPAAIAHLGGGHARGKIVLTV